MTPPQIHTVELKEAVLHDRLVAKLACGPLAHNVAINPGKLDMRRDLHAYPVWSPEQALVSRAKTNFKRLLAAVGVEWRGRGVKFDLGVSLNPPVGKRRCMLASSPDWQAQRLERLFQQVFRGATCDVFDVWSEAFDPYVVVGRERWLFTDVVES